ncbi:MAG TPA: FAD-dependent oxidoreductase [Rhabdochlamydiaceae bacterium]|jgi:glycine/D-amino acid oxidase-like deaminating enzyme|nr:FAD-dependent oxidoreductase [Rhabdochlamydiaceae bacterium]
MKIGIIGAGFAGLACAYYLSEHFEITLFDQKGIGGGASGIASGLLHPYPGEQGRRSWHADEALAAAQELLQVAEAALGRSVARFGGILRKGPCLNPGDDVELLADASYFIKSGITVFSDLYLAGLWKACEKRDVKIVLQKVGQLQELEDFDQIVIAAGAGIRNFPECTHLKINFVKGQVLTLEKTLAQSISSKRYFAVTANPKQCHLGSTYERDFEDEEPDLEKAIAFLQPEEKVVDCRSGIRVTNPAHYFPLLEQINPKTWAVTAFGSRGLLYHAYFGKKIAEKISHNI